MTSNRLPILAVEIRAACDAAEGAMRTTIEHALRCGRLLIEAKAAIAHGQWGAWLKAETRLSERTAQRFMQLARKRDKLEAKSAFVADLTIAEALDLLDDRTELERALALEAEQNALRAEVTELAAQIEAADMAEMQRIIQRTHEIAGAAFENRMRAECRLGRLLAEGVPA